jgi:hypothetical protein
MNLYANLTQCNLKDKISAYSCARIQLVSLYLVLLQSKRSYSKLKKGISLCHMMLLMALSWSNVFYLDRYTKSLQMRKKKRQVTNIHRESQDVLENWWMSTNN